MKVTRSVLIRLVAMGVLKRERSKNGWIYHISDIDYLEKGYKPEKGIW